MVSTMVFVFLIYPTIASYVFSLGNCIEIDGIKYFENETSIECWSSEHLKIFFFVGLPTLLIWIIGFPLLMFFLMFKNRHKLDDKENIMKYGLFYIGFRDGAFYW